MNGCSRRRFLHLLPASLAGVALLPSCQQAGPGVILPDGFGADAGVVTLPFARFPELLTVGGGVVVPDPPLVVVRAAPDRAVALSGICTHAVCPLSYPQGSFVVQCDCHGAEFDLNGMVVLGPAPRPLALLSATIHSDGIIISA